MNTITTQVLGVFQRGQAANLGTTIDINISPLGALSQGSNDLLRVRVTCGYNGQSCFGGVAIDKATNLLISYTMTLEDCLELVNACKQQDPNATIGLAIKDHYFLNLDSAELFLNKLGIDPKIIRQENDERKACHKLGLQSLDQVFHELDKLMKNNQSSRSPRHNVR